jgi:RHS repeat-associated protein
VFSIISFMEYLAPKNQNLEELSCMVRAINQWVYSFFSSLKSGMRREYLLIRNRWYSPHLGRFVTRDPLGYSAVDVNLYRFVGGNPLANIDPFGLKSNCLGYALTGKKNYYFYPTRLKKPLGETLNENGYSCYSVSTVSDCECECDQPKTLVTVWADDDPKNKGVDPWWENFTWADDTKDEGSSFLSDLHGIRQETCNSKWLNIPSFSFEQQTPSIFKNWDLFDESSRDLLCCCKD